MRQPNKHSNSAVLADLEQVRLLLTLPEGRLILSYLYSKLEQASHRLSHTDLCQYPSQASKDQGLIQFLEDHIEPEQLFEKLKEHQRQIWQTTNSKKSPKTTDRNRQ
jgi:hypothetical protein